MVRLACLFSIFMLLSAPLLMSQAQTNLPTAHPEKTQKTDKKEQNSNVSAEVDANPMPEGDGGSLSPWLKIQADALLDVLHCYLDKESLQKETEFEAKRDNSVTHLIEVRIQLLKTLAQHNAASHCK